MGQPGNDVIFTNVGTSYTDMTYVTATLGRKPDRQVSEDYTYSDHQAICMEISSELSSCVKVKQVILIEQPNFKFPSRFIRNSGENPIATTDKRHIGSERAVQNRLFEKAKGAASKIYAKMLSITLGVGLTG